MQDVQSRLDTREIPIDRVGVCDLKYPIIVIAGPRRESSAVNHGAAFVVGEPPPRIQGHTHEQVHRSPELAPR